MTVLEMITEAMRPRSNYEKIVEKTRTVSNEPKNIQVLSEAFADYGNIPIEYSCDGDSAFPTIRWSNLPSDCASLVLIVEDPDAPKPEPFVHGIVFNIPADLKALPSSAFRVGVLVESYRDNGLRLGKNSRGEAAYMPPTPPPGHGPHHYHFQVIALNQMLEFSMPPSLDQVKDQITGRVLASGEVTGVYYR